MQGMQSLAQKSTSTILPRRSSAVSGPLVLIQPAASSGGRILPTYAPAPSGLGRLLCSATSVAAAAISSTSSAQNDPPDCWLAGTGCSDGSLSTCDKASQAGRKTFVHRYTQIIADEMGRRPLQIRAARYPHPEGASAAEGSPDTSGRIPRGTSE